MNFASSVEVVTVVIRRTATLGLVTRSLQRRKRMTFWTMLWLPFIQYVKLFTSSYMSYLRLNYVVNSDFIFRAGVISQSEPASLLLLPKIMWVCLHENQKELNCRWVFTLNCWRNNSNTKSRINYLSFVLTQTTKLANQATLKVRVLRIS